LTINVLVVSHCFISISFKLILVARIFDPLQGYMAFQGSLLMQVVGLIIMTLWSFWVQINHCLFDFSFRF